jgi:hypothetical protein
MPPKPPRRCTMGCGRPARRGGKCAVHAALYEKRRDMLRGSAAQRGYGREHRELRAKFQPIVEAGEAVCWRCGELIEPWESWDLGHDDDDRTVLSRPGARRL